MATAKNCTFPNPIQPRQILEKNGGNEKEGIGIEFCQGKVLGNHAKTALKSRRRQYGEPEESISKRKEILGR